MKVDLQGSLNFCSIDEVVQTLKYSGYEPIKDEDYSDIWEKKYSVVDVDCKKRYIPDGWNLVIITMYMIPDETWNHILKKMSHSEIQPRVQFRLYCVEMLDD